MSTKTIFQAWAGKLWPQESTVHGSVLCLDFWYGITYHQGMTTGQSKRLREPNTSTVGDSRPTSPGTVDRFMTENAVGKSPTYDGHDLKEMFAAATAWLEKSSATINALNVFPVPDGDTGTNMLLTMRSAMEYTNSSSNRSASSVAQALAQGSLMGARGNSGVILSQIFRGLAKGLAGGRVFAGGDFAIALREAANLAYRGLSHPVEGTILTVIREAADAAVAASDSNDLAGVMEAAVNAARDSVARTPFLLPVLKEAGVVDAGGQGLYVLLEGALHSLRGDAEKIETLSSQMLASSLSPSPQGPPSYEEEVYGYCTEFLLQGDGLNPDRIRKKLEKKGQSLIVVGDDKTVKVHLHSLDPGSVLRYATSLGEMHGIKIENMDDQHQEYLQMRKSLAPAVKIATVAVVSGEGLAQVFRSLGVSAIVPGGQSMNPSTQELLRAIEWVPSDSVILLPNNGNVLPAAVQARSLTRKRLEVVPTENIPQGVAALLAFNYEADLKANAQAMEAARLRVRTLHITTAVRSTKVHGLKIKKGQVIGLLEGELSTAKGSAEEVVQEVLPKMDVAHADLVTVYYGADTRPSEAEALAGVLRHKYRQIRVELVQGNQPHYDYIVSVE